MKKLIFLAIIPIFLLLVPNVYASEAPVNCDKNPDHLWCNGEVGSTGIPFCDLSIATGDCYDRENNTTRTKCADDGYNDGKNEQFNHERYELCVSATHNDYYDGFIDGCKSVENTEETCERFTDA